MTTPSPDATDPQGGSGAVDLHRKLANLLFNETWRMMDLEDRQPAEDALMVHQAHASLFHWLQVGVPEHAARGEWQCSRVYTLLRRAEPALWHAARALELCEANGIGDWDLGYAYEALARAHALAGNAGAARDWLDRAHIAAKGIADEGDRELLLDDLAGVEAELSHPRG